MTSPSETLDERPSPVRFQGVAFAMVAAILAASAFAPMLLLLGIGLLMGMAGAAYFVFQAIEGNADLMTLLWVGVFPLGYYFLSFPPGQPIVTFDRIAVLLMSAALALGLRTKRTGIPKHMHMAALAWAVFFAAALFSLIGVSAPLSSVRMGVEVFLFPAILGWYVLACFPVRKFLSPLHILTCIAAIYSAAIGAAEVILGTDLLPFRGARDTFAGGQDVLVLRVNGPYVSNNSFGLIGLVSFCLIWFLRSAIADKMPRWQRALNALGVAAALTAAILPLFRSIFLTIALILVIDLFRQMTFGQRAVRLGVLGLMGTAILAIMLSVPELFEERVSQSGNIYARLAQQKQNVELFLEHPLLGVGLNNFNAAATMNLKASVSYDGVAALDFPHSNPGAVLAETGFAGFMPYVVGNILLVVAFWRLPRNANADCRLSWRFFMYAFLSYWISGFALTSGYYSDLNLCFMFSVAVIYKYAITSR